jgi:hypothetical protein
MNAREKRLIILLSGIAVIFGGVFGYRAYADELAKVRQQREAAELVLNNAELFLDMREEFAEQIDWLAANEPEPQAIQTVRPLIQQIASRQAEAAGLTVQSPSFPASDEGNGYYGRARVSMTVTGTEEALYRWLHELQSPKDFRTVLSMNLAPLRDDPAKITCTVVIEQWFVPEPSPA